MFWYWFIYQCFLFASAIWAWNLFSIWTWIRLRCASDMQRDGKAIDLNNTKTYWHSYTQLQDDKLLWFWCAQRRHAARQTENKNQMNNKTRRREHNFESTKHMQTLGRHTHGSHRTTNLKIPLLSIFSTSLYIRCECESILSLLFYLLKQCKSFMIQLILMSSSK